VIRIAPGIETSGGRKKKHRSGGKNCGGAWESAEACGKMAEVR